MKLGTIRKLEELRVVLKEPQVKGPEAVYWVFSDVSNTRWFNSTVVSPARLGDEYAKTFGHYHPEDAPMETYKLIFGSGVFVMQKKHLKDGQLIPEIVEAVYIVKMELGDEVVIRPEWGHALVNLGDLPLITFDDCKIGHNPADYEPVERLHGMAYYLVEADGKIKAAANPNYQNLPEPIWTKASEFNQKAQFLA